MAFHKYLPIALSAALLGSPVMALGQATGATGTANGEVIPGPGGTSTITGTNSNGTSTTVRVPGTLGGANKPESVIAGGTKTTTGTPAIGTEADGTPPPVPGAVVRHPPSGHAY